MIIALSGKAGSGKDTVAGFMCEQPGVVQVALADPLKRFCKEVFDFSPEQMWGPSELRNGPDLRYKRDGSVLPPEAFTLNHKLDKLETMLSSNEPPEPLDTAKLRSLRYEYLTPRHALQTLGTEWGRECYPHIWVMYAMRIAHRLIKGYGAYSYTAEKGLHDTVHRAGSFSTKRINTVVISDARFINEIKILKQVGAFIVRVEGRLSLPVDSEYSLHRSDIEQDLLSQSILDFKIKNDSTLDELRTRTKDVYKTICNIHKERTNEPI